MRVCLKSTEHPDLKIVCKLKALMREMLGQFERILGQVDLEKIRELHVCLGTLDGDAVGRDGGPILHNVDEKNYTTKRLY